MKEYTKDQFDFISSSGEYEQYFIEDENYILPTRVFTKYDDDDDTVNLRIGKVNGSFYSMIIPAQITYKEAYELLNRTMYWTGINKKDIYEVSTYIEASTIKGD